MNLEDMLPYVLPYVNGCPEPVAIHHLRLAAIEFCARTLLWVEEQDAITAEADLITYAFNLSEGQEVVRLMSASVADREFAIANPTEGRRMVRENTGHDFVFTDNRVDFTIFPAQSAGALIVTECALKPTLDVVDVDDDVFTEHVQDVGFGAIASLTSMPRQDWTSLDVSDRMRARFNDCINTMGVRVSRGFAAAGPRGRAQFF